MYYNQVYGLLIIFQTNVSDVNKLEVKKEEAIIINPERPTAGYIKKTSKNKPGALFKSPVLEKITRTHIAVPVSIFFLYSIGLLYLSLNILDMEAYIVVSLFSIGLITFTWIEYQVHRRLFHIETNSERRVKLQYTIHGIHHDHPKDKSRLAMPPFVSITIATLLLFFLKLLFGDYSFSFLAGFISGYAGYLLVHYIVHIFQPPKNFFRILWVHHSIHHYKDSSKAFGVSSPLWDYIYRTMP